jgi:L-ascorbate metabolism protein UlaG (beta-lactamase superfamily)
MKITKHGQSCLVVSVGYKNVLIDPGTYVFKEEGMKLEDFQDVELVLFTHEHFDHFDLENVKKVIELNKPKVIAVKVIRDILVRENLGIQITEAQVGKVYKFEDYKVEAYKSTHGPLPTGAAPPEVIGYKVTDSDNDSIYSPGDTIKLADTGATVVTVPICGEVVLNIKEAKSELLRVGAKIAIPIHYDNPRFPVDVNDFAPTMADTDIDVKILKWGESIEIN